MTMVYTKVGLLRGCVPGNILPWCYLGLLPDMLPVSILQILSSGTSMRGIARLLTPILLKTLLPPSIRANGRSLTSIRATALFLHSSRANALLLTLPTHFCSRRLVATFLRGILFDVFQRWPCNSKTFAHRLAMLGEANRLPSRVKRRTSRDNS